MNGVPELFAISKGCLPETDIRLRSASCLTSIEYKRSDELRIKLQWLVVNRNGGRGLLFRNGR